MIRNLSLRLAAAIVLVMLSIPGAATAGELAAPAMTARPTEAQVAALERVATVAGGRIGDQLPATSAALSGPTGIARDSSGNLYIADPDAHRVRKVSVDGTITTFAGTGISGFGGDGGPATSAKLSSPKGIAVGTDGSVYIADSHNHRIRRVFPSGEIRTWAGTGELGSGGDGGPATEAQLALPEGLLFHEGELWFADSLVHKVRAISALGVIRTEAGTGLSGFSGDGGSAINAQLRFPENLAATPSGDVLVADTYNHRVRIIDGQTGEIRTFAGNGTTTVPGDGGQATAAAVSWPRGMAVRPDGTVLISDGSARIRSVSTSGLISTVVGTGNGGFSGDGGPGNQARIGAGTHSLLVTPAGGLLICDYSNLRIRLLSAANIVTTVAGGGLIGDGGSATAANLSAPYDIAFDPAGNLYVSEPAGNRLRKITPGGQISVLAGTGVSGYSGDGGPAGLAQVDGPRGLLVGADGSLFFADTNNHRIRKIHPGGIISTVAGSGAAAFGGDGGPATSAQLRFPRDLALDGSGNLIIVDSSNYRVRRIDGVTGLISTVAGNGVRAHAGDGGPATSASFFWPASVAVDQAGRILVADATAARVRRIESGTITTIAGSNSFGWSGDGDAATSARLDTPLGLSVDSSGNIYIADQSRAVVRRVDPAGIISTVAGDISSGTPAPGFNGDGEPPLYTRLAGPTAALVAPDGDLLVVDAGNHRIRRVARYPGPILPTAPRAVAAAAGVSQATITFSPPASDGGSAILGYTVTSHPAGGVDAAAGTLTTERTITGLTNGVAYTFTVTARNAVGTGPDSEPSQQVVPGVPPTTELSVGDTSAIEGNSGTRALHFTISLNEASAAPTSFDIQTASEDAGAEDFQQRQDRLSIPAGATSVDWYVTISGDTVIEQNEVVSAIVSNVVGAQVARAQGDGTIIDDEPRINRLTTFAGNGSNAFSGDGGPATQAAIGFGGGVASDPDGNVYFSDALNHRIRKVSPDGVITTIAGDGNGPSTGGFGGDGGPAIAAKLDDPGCLLRDPAGNLLVCDRGNHRVRKITPAGVITTISGNGQTVFAGDGGPAVSASLPAVSGLAVGLDGSVFISDEASHRIRRVAANGIITTIAGNGTPGFSGDGGPATQAQLNAPGALAVDAAGNLLVVDHQNRRVRRVATGGNIGTVAGGATASTPGSGDGGPATAAWLPDPSGLAVGPDGSFFVGQYQLRGGVRMVAPDGTISTIAGHESGVYAGDGMDARLVGFGRIGGIHATASGALHVVDAGNRRSHLIVPLVPGAPPPPVAVAQDGAATVTITPPPFSGAGPVTGYTLTSVPAGGVDNLAGSSSPNRTVTGLTNGVSYRFQVTASNASGQGAPSALSNAVVPGVGGLPVMTFTAASVVEGNSGARSLVFTANLNTPAPAGGYFWVRQPDDFARGRIATPEKDYVAALPFRVTFPAGATSVSFSIKVFGDTLVEPDELIWFRLTQVTGVTLANTLVRGTIRNDDVARSHPLAVGPEGPNQHGGLAPGGVPISEIQGTDSASSLQGRSVQARGVVTARVDGGFFLQSETTAVSPGPVASQAVYVVLPSTPPAISRGDRVEVRGQVQESTIGTATSTGTRTQLVASNVTVLGSGLPLPAPIPLDGFLRRGGSPTVVLERFEGMRISLAGLDVTGPVGGVVNDVDGTVDIDGVFHGSTPGSVLILRIDSAGQLGALATAADAGDRVGPLVGVLDQVDSEYTVLPDTSSRMTVQPGARPRPAAHSEEGELVLSRLNLRRFFDDRDDPARADPVATRASYALRLAKVANAVCAYLGSPDVLLVDGIEGKETLRDLALAIESEAGEELYPGQCKKPVRYRAWHADPGDGEGLGSGFLVSMAEVRPGQPRVRVRSLEHQARESRAQILRLRADTAGDGGQLLAIVAGEEEWWVLGSREAAGLHSGQRAQPLLDLSELLSESERYSVRDRGRTGTRHRPWASRSLLVAGLRVEYVRLNADFGEDNAGDVGVPLRVSDEDPLLIRLRP